jgi:TPR repeat protein
LRWPSQWRDAPAAGDVRGLKAAAPLLLAGLLAASAAAAQDYDAGREAYVSGNYKRALEIIRPLAEDGHSEAQKLLGLMYDYGHGVPADPERALEWYVRSAEQGDPAVQYQVGAKYFRGDGTALNLREAARWWELAANGGQVDAQFNLGLMYFRGMAVPADDARAAELFRQAAVQEHAYAQYSLAVMYAFGRGLERNYEAALEWFRRSAAQGVSQAQFNLGVFHENGYGVERNLAAAREWYERAAAQGLPEAHEKLAALDEVEFAAGSIVHPEEPRAAVAPAAATPTKAAAAAHAPVVKSGVARDTGARREHWVLDQSPNSYTLQVGSVTREADIRRFLRDAGIEDSAAYIEVDIEGTTRYNALYGVYDSYAAAEAAAADLPPGLRGVKPWIRNFGVLHKLLQ